MVASTVLASAGGTVTHSFEGSCAIVGVAELADPLTLVPTTDSSFSFEGIGRCLGTLDGSVLSQRGVRVSYTAQGPRNIHSCELGLDLGVTWALTFELPDPITIRGQAQILDVLRLQESLVQGEAGGFGFAENTAQGHGETLSTCLGEGLNDGIVAIQMDTVTPLMSQD
jgi:hypothetical protein